MDPLQAFTEPDAKGARRKKREGDSNEDQVIHTDIWPSSIATLAGEVERRLGLGVSAIPLHPPADLLSLDRAR
jgi:hypothetical protein